MLWHTSITSTYSNVTALDLKPATPYLLRVRATKVDETSGWGAWSPTFQCSTSISETKPQAKESPHVPFNAKEATRFITVVRVSERQPANASEVDFLSNHDSGDYESDAAFMTAMGSGGRFIHSFNNSVITQYCIEVADSGTTSSWSADYVSCNPPDTARVERVEHLGMLAPMPNATQVCECVNEMDRRIGHQVKKKKQNN